MKKISVYKTKFNNAISNDKNLESFVNGMPNSKVINLYREGDKLHMDFESDDSDNFHKIYEYISDNAKSGVMVHKSKMNRLQYYWEEYNNIIELMEKEGKDINRDNISKINEEIRNKLKLNNQDFIAMRIISEIDYNFFNLLHFANLDEESIKQIDFSEAKNTIIKVVSAIENGGDFVQKAKEWISKEITIDEAKKTFLFDEEELKTYFKKEKKTQTPHS